MKYINFPEVFFNKKTVITSKLQFKAARNKWKLLGVDNLTPKMAYKIFWSLQISEVWVYTQDLVNQTR